MARRKFIPSAEFPYHVGARVHSRKPYPIPLNDVWHLMCEELWATHINYGFEMHSLVLMPNHFHMLGNTPDANLSDAMRYFQSKTSKILNMKVQGINQVYGGRYFRTLVRSEHHYGVAYKYVYRNPVEAGLCETVEQYPFSTIQMYLGQQTIKAPLMPDDRLLNETNKTLEWLNRAPTREMYTLTKRALSQSVFDFGVDSHTRRKVVEFLPEEF